MSQTPLSISQVVSKISSVFENNPDFQSISCVGEISNLTKSKNGHWYFSLKDQSSKINCVMYQSSTLKISTPIEVGDEVVVVGNVSIYKADGRLQLLIDEMSLYGQGVLYKKYLETRDRLHQKGYFNQKYKKTLPKYPLSIGVIVGANSAAQADIIKTLSTRWPLAEVIQYESLVQGALAPQQIIEKLQKADQNNHDVLLLARGGGSLEDLWAFNDVELVLTIFKMKTPLVTGVGHEIDVTLVDYVADKRGLTPTDAAIQITPDINEVSAYISQTNRQLQNRLQLRLNQAQKQVDGIIHQSLLSRPNMLITPFTMKLQRIENKLIEYPYRFNRIINQFERNQNALFGLMTRFIQSHQSMLNLYNEQLLSKINIRTNYEKQKMNLFKTQLQLKSPLTIMSKGYLVSYQNGSLIKNVNEINPKDSLLLRYHDGSIEVVMKKEKL